MYSIIISKTVDNPRYDEEAVKARKEAMIQGYGRERQYDPEIMDKTIAVPVLTVELTEEEYKTVKKAVIEVVK